MRFAQPLQGKRDRHPKTGKVVLGCLISVGVSYSRLFYPQVPVGLARHAIITEIPKPDLDVTIVAAGDRQLSIDSTLRLARLLRRMRERRLERTATQ
jgi:hypothetical protein